MASAGLLFLISTVSVSTTPGQNQPQKNSSKKFNTAKFISTTLNIIKMFTEAAKPFMLLLPDNGKLANALLSLIGLGAAEINKQINGDSLQAVIYEFEKLNLKLDQYHVDQKWETWASGAYHKPEMDINQTWAQLMILMHNLNETEDEDIKQREREFFMNDYSKYKSATQTLYDLLTAKNPTFINPLGKLLAEHVKCHEKDIKQYTLFIIILMYKGSLMNNLYYEYMKVLPQRRTEANINLLHNTASVMSNKTPYIYKGKCRKSKVVPGGGFTVLIKSDEEIKTNDPCSMQNCGTEERGKCVHVKDVFLGLCECKFPYYGEECKQNLKDLVGEISL